MADKRISQLIERTDIANNDVLPIVASGATTTNKVTISTIQDWMQDNLDVGVTSVGITFGTSGTDINASGSPVTSSGNITINLPTASATNRGALSSADWITFNAKQPAGNYVTLDTAQTITAQKTFTTSGSSDTMIISHGSGSGFALDVIKAGNNEAIRVTKTSGSGNAMSITGGNFSAEAATFSGVVATTPDVVINGVNVGRGSGSISSNTRVGGGALQNNTTGSSNTGVGLVALGNNTTGTRNTSIGESALANNTTGNDNVSVGVGAGVFIADGSSQNSITNNSVYIGSGSRASANNQTNQIVIGHNAIGNGSNTVTIGNSSITNNYFTGNIRGGAFIKTSGTSSEFLMADGSVDSSTYLTTGSASSTYLPLTGGILTGNLTLTASPLSIGAGNGLFLNNPANSQYYQIYTSASNELNFGYGGTTPIVAKIGSTGAATFTGNVTSNGTLTSRTLTNTEPNLLLSRNNADNGFGVIRILDGGTISFENGATGATQTSRLSLDGTTGAATFTGALNGTSASFTGAVAATGVSTNAALAITLPGNANATILSANSGNAAFGWKLQMEEVSTGDFRIFRRESSVDYQVLNLARSTGAATFSSSVTASGGKSQFVASGGASAGAGISLNNGLSGSGRRNWFIGTEESVEGDFQIKCSTAAGGVGGSGDTRLAILNNGNVGIGTASPSGKLSIGGTQGSTIGSNVALLVGNTGANASVGNLFQIGLHYNPDGSTISTIVGSVITSAAGFTKSDIFFATRDVTTDTAPIERMRITSGGNVLFQKEVANNTDTGLAWNWNDYLGIAHNSSDSGDRVVLINRNASDGSLIDFRQGNVSEGSISVSGTTVSYNGGHLSRYSQTELNEKIEGLLKGTVMSNLDQMAEWINPETNEPYENEQLNCMKISDLEGDKNVAGVFVNWQYDSELSTNDMNIAMTGDMIIRIAEGVVVEKGDLLISAGDGTAKPQSDDLIRSNTIAKVISNHVTCVYEDGSYCVPCVLMAC